MTEDNTIITDFAFLSLPPFSPPATQQPPNNNTSPSNPPPLITLEDYSTSYNQDTIAYNGPEQMEITSANKLIFHNNNSTPDNSDSDMPYPPSSAVPSELSSAAASESDLPSVVASEPESPSMVALEPNLLPPHKVKLPMAKMQTGIQSFFRVLSEDEVQAKQAKRKRADSVEGFDPAENWNRKQEKRHVHKQERDRVNQQNRRLKLKGIEIRDGIRDSDGKLVQVS